MSYNKDTGMYEGFIYLITNKVNGKQYVGQTRSTIEERWRNHKCNVNVKHKQKFALHLAMNKYGIENFIIQEIEKIIKPTIEELLNELNEKEIDYIKQLTTLCPNGYNLTEGGESGNNRDFKAVVQYDYNGNYINQYESIVLAANMTDGNAKAISACCKHHLMTSGGYIWEYKGNEPRTLSCRKKCTYQVDQYTINGEFIATYDNANVASIAVNGSPNNIRSACSGNSKISKGYIWRKHGEPFEKYDTKIKHRLIGKSINQFDFNGNFLCAYDEYTPLPDYVINQSVVYDCCNGKCRYAYGYIWTFDDCPPNCNDIPDSQKIVYQYDFNGVFVKEYKNIYIASKELDIPYSSILNCIQGRNNSAGGYMWSIQYQEKIDKYKVKQSQCIDKYDYEGNFIARYDSIKSATESSTIIKNRKSIENCCKGRIEYTRDGIWRYENDPFDKYPFHKFCILNEQGEIIYSSVFQKDLAYYLNIDFRLVSSCLKKQESYNNFNFKIVDMNAKII